MNIFFALGFTAFSVLFLPYTSNAQQSTLSAGGDATGTGGSVSFSIGQVAYQHVADAGGSVYEGVQQPFAGDCIQPTQVILGFTNVSHHGATINWMGLAPSPGSQFVIRYHVFGNSPNFSYKVVSNENASSAYVNGLDPSTQYVFRVGSKCPGSTFATFSDTASFVTKAYCAPPTGVAAALSVDAATLSWDDVGADSYKLKYREVGGTWDYRNTLLTSVDITGLAASTQYEWKVRSICASGNRPYITMQQFNTPSGRLTAGGLGINEFSAYPNPTLGDLTVELTTEENQNVMIELTDLSGRTVGQESVFSSTSGTRSSIDLSGLVAGIYFVRILNSNGILLFSEKVSKQ